MGLRFDEALEQLDGALELQLLLGRKIFLDGFEQPAVAGYPARP